MITTPCDRCKATNQECVIGGSNRGGRRVRRKIAQGDSRHDGAEHSFLEDSLDGTSELATAPTEHNDYVLPASNVMGANTAIPIDPLLKPSGTLDAEDPYLQVTRESSTGTSNIAFDELQNPSDALGILAQIASSGEGGSSFATTRGPAIAGTQHVSNYALIRNGDLTQTDVFDLLRRYQYYYHPYFPLVPRKTLDVHNLGKTVHEEPHLVTAILVIASRDLVERPDTFLACSKHMKALVSDLAAGGPGNVEAVEALLLLAEWTPYTSRSDAGNVGRGEEDREAWMHVGTALRIGYFLGLDRYSFAVRGDDARDPQWQRKRLVWTTCYISDRQISIRLGRAFWSRGPGPLTTLRKEDFPMLAPAAPGDEDFAGIFQATLELTLLFSNVHDVLYSNPGNSMRSHLSGGYIKYIDDFRSAIYGWKSVWGTLTCAPNLKATLLMSYDYLRLYTNAFAFHATVKRAAPQVQGQSDRQASLSTTGRIFYNNVGAVGDARFIYEGLDAAKSLLSMVNSFVDPEKSLRYMPLRFYLYSIYSGVFLYRARCVGVLAADEEQSVRIMIQETVNRLERSGIGSQHPGNRYSKLLRLLWDKVDRKNRKDNPSSAATLANPYRPQSGAVNIVGTPSNVSQDSPAVTEQMGDFSWTDLDAIGNFAVNGSGGANAGEVEWWSGFLPADSSNFLFDTLPMMDDPNWNLT